jgi:hypothetical protein
VGGEERESAREREIESKRAREKKVERMDGDWETEIYVLLPTPLLRKPPPPPRRAFGLNPGLLASSLLPIFFYYTVTK